MVKCAYVIDKIVVKVDWDNPMPTVDQLIGPSIWQTSPYLDDELIASIEAQLSEIGSRAHQESNLPFAEWLCSREAFPYFAYVAETGYFLDKKTKKTVPFVMLETAVANEDEDEDEDIDEFDEFDEDIDEKETSE